MIRSSHQTFGVIVRFSTGIIIAALDVLIAAAIWVYSGKPDFYFRSGEGIAISFFFALIWWEAVFCSLFVVLRLLRISSFEDALGRCAVFLAIAFAAIYVFHLYEFRVRRLCADGLLTTLLIMVFVLVELAGKLIRCNRSPR